MRHSNKLAHESSPYLLQHAHNPVAWYPWGEEALALARTQNKPIILSIGYSACHWCHVMERESFENEQIAAIMNAHFICIKVDREERPDVDQIYMESVQAMGIQGGWPLNVFLTSDERPFYGGTYFPPNQWASILQQVANAYHNNHKEISESADLFTRVLQQSDHERYEMDKQLAFGKNELATTVKELQKTFDTKLGGLGRAPKFPMPTIYSFLLKYCDLMGDDDVLAHVHFSLQKMAFGGIYDQIGGGFARYSVDAEWFAPHFEKMLYDNAQLISLYAEAYNLTSDIDFLQIVEESIDFIIHELYSPEEGAVYAALDADSEGVEGLFYTWTYQELKEIIPEADFDLFCAYYNAVEGGNWEDGRNILYKLKDDDAFAEQFHLSFDALSEKIAHWKQRLLDVRKNRIRPGLDDKILSSWNGLMIKAFSDAYMATGRVAYLAYAQQLARFINDKMTTEQGKLYRTYKNGKATLDGYLEDYAAVIQGYYTLYQAGFEKVWLEKAQELTEYVFNSFADDENPLFFFTDKHSSNLIARKKEIFDNVIPSSNSLMATNLYFLGVLLGKKEWVQHAKEMLDAVSGMLKKSVRDLTHWASLATLFAGKTSEVVIVGRKCLFMALELRQTYIPNKVVVTSQQEDDSLELLKGRIPVGGKTTVYVCYDRTCQLPVHTPEDAVEIIKNNG